MTAAAGGRPLFGREAPAPGWTFALACLAIALAGAWLRLDQFTRQVLLDDEWHVIHQLLQRGPAEFVFDLGHADYSIPLALYDWGLLHTLGLSETAMRVPMMAAGLATIALLPLGVATRLGRETAVAFALFVALSPPLVAFSQIARPYALTLLLAWYGHWAFQRWWNGRAADGWGYAIATTLACWLHLIIAPFVLAPFLWAGWRMARDRATRRAQLKRTIVLGAAVALALAALLGPPLVGTPQALGAKSGFRPFDAATLGGAAYWWLGTRSTVALIVMAVLAGIGMPRLWRTVLEARTGALGIALVVAGLAVTRPEWGFTTLAFGRYLLPVVPLVLCAAACGAVTAGAALTGRGKHRRLAAGVIVAVAASGLVASSPLREWTRTPSSYRLGILHLFDFRDGPNAARASVSAIPMSPFWHTLADRPPDSLVVAVAPFRFESYDWDGFRWERESRQRVIPGWLTGLCVDHRWGEIPARPGYAFENAVRLSDRNALAERGVDYVVWQKKWMAPEKDRLDAMGDRFPGCEDALRRAFGPPAFEDGQVVAFRLPAASAGEPR